MRESEISRMTYDPMHPTDLKREKIEGHREDEEKWLDCSATPFDKVQSLLKPFPAELMAAHKVSKRMNNPKYDAPDCNAPVEG